MSRWAWFSICAILGLLMLICGLLVPSHLRAVDASVLERAGRRTPSLVDQAFALARDRQLGAALLDFQAAQRQGIREAVGYEQEISKLATSYPEAFIWGGLPPVWAPQLKADARQKNLSIEPFTELVLKLENRSRVVEILNASRNPDVLALLGTRSLTNTIVFPSSQSSAGQAFDAALSVCGLLVEGGRLRNGMRAEMGGLIANANRGADPARFEQMLLDFMSLGQRFNWVQLEVFASQIETVESLRLLTSQVRNAGANLPELFAAVQMTGRPADVTRYLMNFSESGPRDLGRSLRFGAGGVNELLNRGLPFYESKPLRSMAQWPLFGGFADFILGYSWVMPSVAMSVKWGLYLVAGFLLALAMHLRKPAVSVLERPLQVPGVHIAQEILFALGFLVVVLLLSEPFLSQESQKVDVPFRLHLPRIGSLAVSRTVPVTNSNFMSNFTLLNLLLFFVLQMLLYIACLIKLAEINRQQLSARIKLRLLENEEHLFDAGLYLGFAGTIISLILVSLNVVKPSLMAAYSSTSFGIIFVSIFKIFHLRPTRRRLLMESESALEQTEKAASARRANPVIVTPTAS